MPPAWSTFIQRIITPAPPDGSWERLPVNSVVSIAWEIQQGRLPNAVMATFLSTEEKAEADFIFDQLGGNLSLDDVRSALILGERKVYDEATIRTIFGLSAMP